MQGLNQQFANDVLRIVSLQFVLFACTLFIKKKSMQGLNQQFFVASIHLTSGCYWLWNECWKSVWNECWECAQEVLMRQTFHGDTQLARFIIVNIGKEPHSSYCQEKTSNLAAFFFFWERERGTQSIEIANG